MKKSTKIMIISIAAAVAVCLLIVILSVTLKGKTPQDTTTTTTPSTDAPQSYTDTSLTTEPTTQGLQTQILGAWRDSADMSGFEFFDDGTVNVTYVNLNIPVVNFPINGSATGSYTLTGDHLTITFSIYTKTITREYFASVSDNKLTLREYGGNDVSTYMRAAAGTPTTIAAKVNDDIEELTGSWANGDNSVRYLFKEDGFVTATYRDAKLAGANGTVNGTADGIYMLDGKKITMQFMINGNKLTLNGTYAVSKNTLSITDDTGDTTLFIRSGTDGSGSTAPEDLLGTWKDGTGSRGYEFMDGGIVKMTYVDIKIPVVNMPITGTYDGTYSVEDDLLTLRYSIYGAASVDTYRFVVEGNSLTMTNIETGVTSVYQR